ncbi:hypothetical protein SAMN05421681_10751 [Lysobacter enzymogenes]|nr:hypothetical protein SAMN05421681_10751 [Lysobacter enzymogenes]
MAADVQLAGAAGRHRLAGGVEHVDAGVEQRPADRRRSAVAGGQGVGGDLHRGRPHRGFGRPVQIGQPRGLAHQLLGQFRLQGFAADQRVHAFQARVRVGQQHAPQRRGGLHRIDALFVDQPRQRQRIARDFGGGQHRCGADGKRQEQLQAGDVEGDRGLGEIALARLGPQLALHRLEEIPEAALADFYALGHAGGTGGVDHVGQLRAADLRQRRRGFGVVALVLGVGEQQRHAAAGERIGEGRRGQQQARRGVVQGQGDALHRRFRIQRQIGRAGLPHRQQRGRQHFVARQRDRDRVAGAHAARDQPVGQAGAGFVELAIAQSGVAGDHRHRIGRARGLTLELRQRGAVLQRFVGGVPLVQQALAFFLAEHVDRAQGDVGAFEHLLDQAHQPALVLVEFGGRVQGGIGVEVEAQALAVEAVEHEHGQVFGGAVVQVARAAAVAEEVVVVVRLDVDAEPGHVLVRIDQAQVAAQFLEAVLLMAQRRLDRTRGLLEQLAHAHVRAHLQADRNHVGDHARGAAQRMAGAAGDRHAEHQVVGAAGAVVIGRDQRDQHLRQAHAVVAGDFHQTLAPGLGHAAAGAAQAAVVAHATARQGHRFGQVGELLQPVLAVAAVAVGIAIGRFGLDQRGQRAVAARFGLDAVAVGAIQLVEALGRHAAAVAVVDGVVGALVPAVQIVGVLEDRADPQRVVGQIDRTVDLGLHPAFGGGARIGLAAEIDVGRLELVALAHDLIRQAVVLDDARAHGLRFVGELAQRALEQRRLDRPVDLHRLGDVQSRFGRGELLSDPQAALGGGERQAGCMEFVHGASFEPAPGRATPPAAGGRAVRRRAVTNAREPAADSFLRVAPSPCV